MVRVVLEVPQDKDLELLLALLKRLDIRIVQKSIEPEQAATGEDRKFILEGLPARDDFDTFVGDFEESRQDRSLPGRQD